MTTTTATTTGHSPRVGEMAPDFTLNTSDGTPWTLSQAVQNGPVVLAFMPGAFTTPCTKEMCTFTDNLNTYKELNAQVVGVTVDSRHAQNAWKQRDNIQVPLLSDFEKTVSSQWGNLWDAPWGKTNRRSTFVIDRSMKVRFAFVQEKAGDDPPYADVQAALKGLV
jgi:glutaredoxin-dependent peroxiredoxin